MNVLTIDDEEVLVTRVLGDASPIEAAGLR
jgi:hypothetical protein